jgi:hypothetical protein
VPLHPIGGQLQIPRTFLKSLDLWQASKDHLNRVEIARDQRMIRYSNFVTEAPINLHDDEIKFSRFDYPFHFSNFSSFTPPEIHRRLSDQGNEGSS